jgi:hypothetical protein
LGSWLCENAKTLNDDRKSDSSETVLGLQIEIAFNLRIEMENVIPVVFRFFCVFTQPGSSAEIPQAKRHVRSTLKAEIGGVTDALAPELIAQGCEPLFLDLR